MRRVAALAALALLLATGCKPVPQHGYIQQRQYVPARDWIDSVPQYQRTCISVPYTYTVSSGTSTRIVMGTRQSCTSTLTGYLPVHRHEPAYWRFLLKDDDDPDNIQWRDVTPQEYDRYDVGQHYPDPR